MNIQTLTGRQIVPKQFRARKTERILSNEDFMATLTGRCPAIVVKKAITPAMADSLSGAYLGQQAKRREDGVPAHEIGIGGYGLAPEEYFMRVMQTRADMDQLYSDAKAHLPTIFHELIHSALDPGMFLRQARLEGRIAADFRAIHFADQGPLALRPHEDRSQALGYEYNDCLVICGANFYVRTPEDAEGGVLRMWNITPSDAVKEQLGVQATGYPYPVELLEDVPYIDIRPQAGDLVIFSADCIHAVTSWQGAAEQRVVFQSFLGLTASGHLLHWT